MTSKTCTKCKTNKSVSEFHKAPFGKFGVKSVCKVCCRKAFREYYRRDIDKSRSRNRKSMKKLYESNPQKFRDRSNRYRELHKNDPVFREKKLASDRSLYHRSKVNKEWLAKERARIAEWKRNNRPYERARWMAYHAAKKQRIPKWANLEKIQEIYNNCPEGYEVDHIIPLQGEIVSGLHVENNLQYLTRSENASKGNRLKVGA